jgi:hypothetical protein
MSTIEVNKITPVSGGTATTLGDSGDTFTVTSGATFNASSSNLANRPNVAPLLMNCNMAVSQRNGTTATTIGSEAYSLDRWSFREISQGSTTVQQTTTVPSGKGFANSLKVAVTGADTSIIGDNIVAIAQKLEGQDAQLLKFGTSDAQKVTISFWVRSNVTGTYSATLRHTNTSGTAYVNSLTFSISSGDTWEQKVLVFNANTSQDIRNTNSEGIRLEIILTAGSDYTSGGGANANTWTTGNTNRASASNVNILSSTSNTFYLTGVQMEVGEYTSSTLPPFQYESFGNNLARCQRYFLFTGGGSNYSSHGTGVEASSTSAYCNVPLSTVMRSTPSVTKRDTLTIFDGNGESDITSIGTPYYGKQGTVLQLQLTASGGGLSDNAGLIVYSDNSSTAGFLIDAEL